MHPLKGKNFKLLLDCGLFQGRGDGRENLLFQAKFPLLNSSYFLMKIISTIFSTVGIIAGVGLSLSSIFPFEISVTRARR
jgi:hypothetical protein